MTERGNNPFSLLGGFGCFCLFLLRGDVGGAERLCVSYGLTPRSWEAGLDPDFDSTLVICLFS